MESTRGYHRQQHELSSTESNPSDDTIMTATTAATTTATTRTTPTNDNTTNNSNNHDCNRNRRNQNHDHHHDGLVVANNKSSSSPSTGEDQEESLSPDDVDEMISSLKNNCISQQQRQRGATAAAAAGGGGGTSSSGGDNSSSLELRRQSMNDSFVPALLLSSLAGYYHDGGHHNNNNNNTRTSTDELLSSAAAAQAASAAAATIRPSVLAARSDSIRPTIIPKHKSNFLLVLLLRVTCLNPKLSLRTQLMFSFGCLSIFTIGLVWMICIISAKRSGYNVKRIHQGSIEELFTRIQGTLAPYLSESLTRRLIPTDAIHILVEATQDRFMGYPNPTDDYVPFDTIENGDLNQYPIQGKVLPLHWQMDMNRLVTHENATEHLQDRWKTLFQNELVNTEAYYHMRGSCNPKERSLMAPTYLPRCTPANNNISTGGIDAPTKTNAFIYQKSSDLAPLMKSLFEFHQDIEDLYIYFVNDGAGSYIRYPHVQRNITTYISTGCEWMNEPNPYNSSKPIGTKEMMNRCRINGTKVNSLVYNPLERDWCPNTARYPNRTSIVGPFMGVTYRHLILSVFRAVYDRLTNELIGVVAIVLSLEKVNEVVKASSIKSVMEVSLVRFDPIGTLVTSSRVNISDIPNNSTYTITDINVGLTQQSYQDIWLLVDYTNVWDPKVVRNQYTAYKVIHQDGFQVSAFPIPPIPDVYDVDYRPEFFVFLSVYENAIAERIQQVNRNVDDRDAEVIKYALVIGGVGIIIMLGIILAMSHMITMPLRMMNQSAQNILGNFGRITGRMDKILMAAGITRLSLSSIATTGKVGSHQCLPKTELSQVTEEFHKMITSLSGSSMATPTRLKLCDDFNKFTLQQSFRDLYRSRNEKSFFYQIPSKMASGHAKFAGFIHRESNMTSRNVTARSAPNAQPNNLHKRFGSSLFMWITILIVIPLILTTVGISSTALYQISKAMQRTVQYAEESYIDLELSALEFYTQARADYVSSATAATLRDLHILSRYTSWLFFGGLNRTDTFIEMNSGQEPCKAVANATTCSYYRERYACDCKWNDIDARVPCQVYPNESRYLQKAAFACQSFNTSANGDRNSTSFPNDSFTPATTGWWYNVSAIPGSEKGALASGYGTTYDRLRVASSIPIFQVLYNYDKAKEHVLASYVSFEADGLFLGYNGCPSVLDSVRRPQFLSSESNGAARLRPDLCPLGKYGYDPRCREWYDTGKKLAASRSSAVYLTPPYLFAGGKIALSATAAFTDPETNSSLGQLLVDFRAKNMYAALQNYTVLAKGGFPILVTVRPNFDGADTVIGPGFTLNEPSKPISPLVLPFDRSCSNAVCQQHISQFESIKTSMRQGASNSTHFYRTSSDGSEEKAYISYAPITATFYQPVNSSDFLRGVEPSQYLLYSLGIVETERGLLEPYWEVEQKTQVQIRRVVIVMIVVISVAILFLVYMSYVVTTSLTEPMIFLIKVMQGINRMDVDDEPPQLEWSASSRELTLFTETMDNLYRVMRAVNRAYFGGDLEKAYFALDDALTLFRRLGNEKAIGVACNNLGNIVLALYCRMQQYGKEGVGELSRQSIIRKGITCYTAAIRLGEKTYEQLFDQEGWTPACLDFTQNLSNRYFNRAMFILTVSKDHEQGAEMAKRGFRDVQISRDMDVEIAMRGEEFGWGNVNRTEKLFEVALVRACGHLLLRQHGYTDNWDVEHVLNNTFLLLKGEMSQGSPGLFREIGPIGRLQQVETVLMQYHRLRGSLEIAAQIAIRCLFEDEFVLPDAEYQAVLALFTYENGHDDENAAHRALKEKLKYYLRCCYLETQYDRSIDPTKKKGGDKETEVEDDDDDDLDTLSQAMSSSELQHMGEYVTMEVF